MIKCWKERGIIKDSSDFISTSLKERVDSELCEVLIGDNVNIAMLKCDTLCALMQYYFKEGMYIQVESIWNELWHSSYVPNIEVINQVFNAYGAMGRFKEIFMLLRQLKCRGFDTLVSEAYSVAICCFGRFGAIELMKVALKEMKSGGLEMDSKTANAFLVYYSVYGTLFEMEGAYVHVKRSGILVESEGIRAVALAYIKNQKYYKLGEFTKDVGLGRRNAGNLLWNLLLLSYAVNFKMKSLQREFLNMIGAGFRPDVTTFNIRALAFSKMALFWDLHLTLEHMKYEGITPDVVTYGSVIDAYMDKRLAKSLPFALNKMDTLSNKPIVSTDQIVFDALGKGDFHSNAEAFLEFSGVKKWTYQKLVATYLRKKFRSNQVFWNY